MKIRIQANSIRYRLKEPEVAYFKEHGTIKETLLLGKDVNNQLHFVLQASSIGQMAVRHSGNTTIVEVPQALADHWTGSDEVGFDALIAIGEDQQVMVLVEKDFKCLDRSAAENAGAYPNPKEHC